MDSAEMLRRQRAAKQTWLELDDPPRRALLLRRPAENMVAGWRRAFVIGSVPENVKDVVVDWRHFTEADLLGPSIGGSEDQPFHPANFAEWLDDEPKVQVSIAEAAVAAYKAHSDAKAAAEKN